MIGLKRFSIKYRQNKHCSKIFNSYECWLDKNNHLNNIKYDLYEEYWIPKVVKIIFELKNFECADIEVLKEISLKNIMFLKWAAHI